jgi:thiol-disulfide isomerase/thioredoxin
MRLAKSAASMIVLLAPLVGLVIARGGLEDRPVEPAAQISELLLRELNVEPLNQSLSNFDLALQDLQGKRINLLDLRGKVVLLNFWATWCPSCKLEMPSMEVLHERLGNEGLMMLAVNVRESVEEVRAFFQEHNLSFSAILDPEGRAFERFYVWSLPTTFIIDRKGKLLGKIIGYRDWDSEQTIRVLQMLLETPT